MADGHTLTRDDAAPGYGNEGFAGTARGSGLSGAGKACAANR